MAVAVSKISPGRSPPGDAVTIEGSGFSASFGQNVVTIDGVVAGVNAFSATALEVVVPLGIVANRHAEVVVTNLDDATSATWWLWISDTAANVEALVLTTKVPGFGEKVRGLGRLIKNMNVAEARFFERIATKIELVPDLLDAIGSFFSRSGSDLGLRRAAPGVAGQPFVSAIDDVGGQFQDRQCQTLQWGVTIDGTLLSRTMRASAPDTFTTGGTPYEISLSSGQLVLLSLRERNSGSGRINKVELYVDDVLVYEQEAATDEWPGLGLLGNQTITLYPNVRVAQGARVSLVVFRSNDLATNIAMAYALVV